MNFEDLEGHASFSQELSKKIQIKVLEGRIDANSREKKMVLAYRKSGLTPQKFLKKWKG